jgi:Transposase DDE domain group 1
MGCRLKAAVQSVSLFQNGNSQWAGVKSHSATSGIGMKSRAVRRLPAGQDAAACAVINAAVHHSKSSIIVFGANAAWWALAILAFNLNTAMKRLVLGKGWVTKRIKALRFHLIALPGRVVSHARQLIIRLSFGTGALASFITARQTIRSLECALGG